ncbi:hypothetical protein BDA99DRAFT_557033 [Phascolomyces articulosus]|uniref:Actin-like ATPase domain-containing protein n=1 Tax=Phascolomyces articulosus TaxID=60185 RepID=A0AAD5K6R9_9FUNG|nr:hypothetical protein BDA99DRAFT_557033 [Phascolomyces articulosus]
MSQSDQQQSSEYKVIIAYDFGTTYSGAAYAFTHSSPVEVFDIQKWPHKAGNFSPKVPTLSVYPRRIQQQQTGLTLSEWGHGAKKAMLKPAATKQNILLSRFKLQLDESLNCPPLENGLTPVQAVADYLSALHKHTLDELTRGFAKNYGPDTFRYCLTVPALWSDKAKQLMRQAAIEAGVISRSDPSDRLVLISEPEAAALYCEETMIDQVQLHDNDRFMVCDAGGGTVDLIVFQVNFTDPEECSPSENGNDTHNNINNVAKRKKRQLKEVTKGMGESCGSVFLDGHFHELLEEKLGTHVMSKIYPREMNDLMDQFIDKIKPEFNGTDDYFISLPRSVELNNLPASLRDSDDGSLEEGILTLSGQELKEKVFDPVVNKVISLIDQQYQQIPDHRLNFLFLVGGFGSSKYLYQRIQNVFQNTKVNQIVYPAERAALAVVRGAAYYGLNPRVVVSRVSRRTYGTRATLPYDDKIDPPSKRVVKPDGSVRCNDGFYVYVKKNDVLEVDRCIEEEFSIYYGQDKSVDLDIYATEDDIIPRYCDAAGVHCISDISVPVPTMPDMKMGEKLYFSLRMYFGTTEIRMEIEFSTGQKYNVYGDFDATDNYSS